jgi:hypothetical protein
MCKRAHCECHLKLLTNEFQAHGLGDDFKVVDQAELLRINFTNERRALAILQQCLQRLLSSACDPIIHFCQRW